MIGFFPKPIIHFPYDVHLSTQSVTSLEVAYFDRFELEVELEFSHRVQMRIKQGYDLTPTLLRP